MNAPVRQMDCLQRAAAELRDRIDQGDFRGKMSAMKSGLVRRGKGRKTGNQPYIDTRLLRRVESYLTASRVPATRLGRIVCNDPRMIGDLRKGILGQKRRGRLSAYLEERSA